MKDHVKFMKVREIERLLIIFQFLNFKLIQEGFQKYSLLYISQHLKTSKMFIDFLDYHQIYISLISIDIS